MTAPLALLPMYDRREVRAETDRLWVCLRDALRAAGLSAPDTLDRDIGLMEGWRSPRLALAQTCGLPYVRHLAPCVTLLGTPDYAVEGCTPGWYRSEVVVRADDPRDTLAGFRGATVAMNDPDSQSGHAALLHLAAPLAQHGRFFGKAILTGAHAASVAAVAAGEAEIAAIDAVSWRLFAGRVEEASRLRILCQSPPTPGLPLISSASIPAGPARAAVAAGLAVLDAAARETLGIHGFVPLDARDYSLIDARFAKAGAVLSIL